MTIFQPNNPGLGGLDELTDAEEAFVTSLAGLSYVEDDVLIYQSGSLINVNHPFVKIAGDTMTGNLDIQTTSTTAPFLNIVGNTNTPSIQKAAALSFNITETGSGILAQPIGLFSTANFNGTGLSNILTGSRIVANQQSSSNSLGSILGQTIQITSTGSSSLGNAIVMSIIGPSFDTGVPTTIKGIRITNQGAAGITTSTGLEITQQTGAADNYGIILLGDGIGADIVFGAGLNSSILYDGTDMVFNSQLTGTGDFVFSNGDIGKTGTRVTKGWFTDLEVTNMPTVGGTSIQDTFVDVAGDTMTGNLSVDANVDVSGKMAVGSGAVLGGSTGRSVLALEETTNLSGFGEFTPALEFTAITTGTGLLSIPIGLSATARVDSSGGYAQLRGIQTICEQNSTTALANAWGLYVQLKSTAAGTGNLGISAGLEVQQQYSGGAPLIVRGVYINDMSHAAVNLAYGLFINKQTKATSNFGMVLNGDGAGADIVFGAGQDASILYDGTDLTIDPKVVGTGGVNIKGDTFWTGSGTGLPYADLYVVENTNATTITTINTWYQILDFNTNGVSNLMTPDHTNDHITIDKTGTYEIKASISLDGVGGGGDAYEVTVFKNNGATAIANVHGSTYLSGGSKNQMSLTISGLASLTATDTIEVWIKNVTGTNNVIVEDITLSIVMIGG